VTIKALNKNLQQWHDPEAEVIAFDVNSGDWQSLTGTLYDPVRHEVEICTDEL